MGIWVPLGKFGGLDGGGHGLNNQVSNTYLGSLIYIATNLGEGLSIMAQQVVESFSKFPGVGTNVADTRCCCSATHWTIPFALFSPRGAGLTLPLSKPRMYIVNCGFPC